MSTNEQNPVETTTDDLDAFSAEFFGQKSAAPPQASEEEVEIEDVEVVDANEEDTHDGEDDTPAPDDEDGDEEEEAPAPKPKKNRFQERIDELTAKARTAERELEALKARLEQNEKPAPAPKVEESTGPAPEDKNEDGTDKYPLGEFDPQYIRDLTRHTLESERQALKEAEARESEQKAVENQKAALEASWTEKLGPAQERYPDFQEKGQQLVGTFDGIEPAYGEYLTATLMSMDYGPDVLYYLANNLDEANKIVAAGPTMATIALGRLEAKFAFAEEEKQKSRPKISKAPTPPTHLNKGSAPAKADIPDDTDDLDAFSSKFFVKKGR